MNIQVGNENLTKKKLPIRYPMITTYTQHAHLLSILTNYEQTLPWIFSNYIQVYANKHNERKWVDFYFPFPYELRPSDTCKWIKSQKISRDFIGKKWDSIIDFIIDFINSDNYVHLMINCFYIPHYIEYRERDYIHDILVYGYDRNEESLYVADFFSQTQKYSFQKVSFADFTQAFLTHDLAKNRDYLKRLIYIYQFDSQCDYQYHTLNIINSFKLYLSSNVLEYWDIYNQENREQIIFGMDVFEILRIYLDNKMIKDETNIDIRPFYMLYDHKKIMTLRIQYLVEQRHLKKDIINTFKEIETEALMIVNLLIKYTMKKRNTLILNVIHKLNEIGKKEYHALRNVLFDLNCNDDTSDLLFQSQ
jgi:hypothetical protein